jgi:competence protein ComEA
VLVGHEPVVQNDNMQMPAITRGRALAYLAAVLLALVLGGRFLVDRAGAGDPGTGSAAATFLAHAGDTGPTSDTGGRVVHGAGAAGEADAPVLVHVAGAVRRPGVYEMPSGSRVDDAIREAGGATRKASLDLLNLAAPLVDGQQVLVPRRGAVPAAPTAAASASGAGAPLTPVRLSTATLAELDSLPGVGPVTAQKIVDYRDEHGPFASVEELDAIPGIGPARLEQLRELVVP